MKEDLIEAVTSLMVSGQLGEVCLQLCRLSTLNEEKDLKDKFQKFADTKIHELGVSNWFTLDKTSKLHDII